MVSSWKLGDFFGLEKFAVCVVDIVAMLVAGETGDVTPGIYA